MKTPNPVKLYTINVPLLVDTNQLNSERTILRIYDSKGRKLSDTGRTAAIREAASFGVHRDNLFASRQLAEKNMERIEAELWGDRLNG